MTHDAAPLTSTRLKLQNAAFLSRICVRKPRFFTRLLAEFFRARALGHQRLRFMDIAVDYACNMKCTHCSASNFHKPRREGLSLDEYRRIAATLREAGCLIFHFTGGEPLLRKDLEHVIAAFDPSRCAISIQSNGLLATAARLASLREAGADIFCVSLDSGIDVEHDAFRRMPGAFDRALRAVDDAVTLGFSVSISTCISHANLRSEGLREVMSLAARRGIWCYFNLAVPAGNWRGNEADLLTPDDQTEWRRLVAENPQCRIDLESNWLRVGCGAVKEKGYLTAYGDVMPCPFLHVSLGNLRDETIADVRQRALRIPQFAQYWPRCLAAEDRAFMELMAAAQVREKGVMPVSYEQFPWMNDPPC